MTTTPEVAANLAFVAAVFLAARNNIHHWRLGIIGCALFAYVYYQNQLCASATLQGFLILISVIGW